MPVASSSRCVYKELQAFGERHPNGAYVIVPMEPNLNRLLRREGYTRVMKFQHDYDEQLNLWKFVGSSDKPDQSDAESADTPVSVSRL